MAQIAQLLHIGASVQQDHIIVTTLLQTGILFCATRAYPCYDLVADRDFAQCNKVVSLLRPCCRQGFCSLQQGCIIVTIVMFRKCTLGGVLPVMLFYVEHCDRCHAAIRIARRRLSDSRTAVCRTRAPPSVGLAGITLVLPIGRLITSLGCVMRFVIYRCHFEISTIVCDRNPAINYSSSSTILTASFMLFCTFRTLLRS